MLNEFEPRAVWGERVRERRMIHKQVNLCTCVFYTILKLNGFMNVTRSRAPFFLCKCSRCVELRKMQRHKVLFLRNCFGFTARKKCFWREANDIVSHPAWEVREWKVFYGKLGILIHVACSDVWILCDCMEKGKICGRYHAGFWGLFRRNQVKFLWFDRWFMVWRLIGWFLCGFRWN